LKSPQTLPAKKVTFGPYLLFLLLSQLILICFLWYQKTYHEQEHLAALIATREAEYHHVLSDESRLANTIFAEVINMPEIVQIVKDAALLDEKGRKRNRDLLFARLSPAYERLRKDRVRQVHFHFADGTSFLRLHHPKEFGDHLFAARPSVRLANTQKTYVEGFEQGRDFHAFRHVFPLFFAGEHVGSVEIGVPFYLLRRELVELHPSANWFLLKKEVVESIVFKENRMNYIPSEISADFLMEKDDVLKEGGAQGANHLDLSVIKKLNRGLQNELAGQLANDKPFVVVASGADGTYVVTALPVMDVEGKVAGDILYYQKDLALSELLLSYYVTYGAITLLMLLLMGLYLWSTKKIAGQNTFLQTIIESLPYPFYVVDAKDYSVRIANSLVAVDKKWQGLTCHALTHKSSQPCDEKAHACPLKQVMQTKGEVVLEHIHSNLAGEERQVEVHGCPIFDEAGNVVQMIEYAIDITTRKLAEQERERLIADLQTALRDIKQLSGFIPICASCKNIRNDQGYWQKIEQW
jgi:PAS domain-containing protein